MITRISAVDARRNLGKLLNMVSIAHEEIIIERAGKPIARLSHCEAGALQSSAGKLDLRKSRGLGKDLWHSVNVDDYIRKEREGWD